MTLNPMPKPTQNLLKPVHPERARAVFLQPTQEAMRALLGAAAARTIRTEFGGSDA